MNFIRGGIEKKIKVLQWKNSIIITLIKDEGDVYNMTIYEFIMVEIGVAGLVFEAIRLHRDSKKNNEQ